MDGRLVGNSYTVSADYLTYLFIDSYSVVAVYYAALPELTGVADSGRGADVDPRRPTSSFE